MSVYTLLIVILVLMMVGAFPGYSYSRDWGYAPVGGIGLMLVIIVLFLLLGRK